MKRYKINYKKRFIKDIEKHKKNNDDSVIEKIKLLIDELSEHPRTGAGKPKPLKGNKKGEWSRRITSKHRLVYEINDNVVSVTLVSSLGHYQDK